MLLLVGLGNPGDKYRKNRHNIGFMAVDEIIRRHDFSVPRKRFQSTLCEGRIGRHKVLALKPQTFMNESGRAVGQAMRFYKMTPGDVIVLYDELDLAFGKVKVKTGGGTAGHNGIRSIASHIGPDFMRVRLGIGHPGDKARVTGHVLGDFARSEETALGALLGAVAERIGRLADGDAPRFMSDVALTLAPAHNNSEKRNAPEKPLPEKPLSEKPLSENTADTVRTAAKPATTGATTEGPLADALRALKKED